MTADSPLRFRRAVPGDEGLVRDLRLRALSDEPDAFGSTTRDELAKTEHDWTGWIDGGATFVAEHNGRPRGIATGFPYDDEPGAVLLVSMWVHESLRGAGAAGVLVDSVVEWAAETGASEVVLHVTGYNERARRFYERHGFRLSGVEIVRERDGMIEREMRRRIGAR